MAKVLIVDDERGIRNTLREFLLDEGHDVFTAENGASAMDIMQSEPIDVTVSDLFLANEDGLELVKNIRERWPDIPIIIITGDPSLSSAVDAIRAGAHNYLYKPVKPEAMCLAVSNAAKVKTLRDENQRLFVENQRHREHLEEMVRHRSEELRKSEEKYRLLAENAQDMIWRTDSGGVVEFVNPAVETLLGYRPDEAIGLPLQQYMTEESRLRVRDWVKEALRQSPPKGYLKGEVDYVHKSGHIVFCEFNVTMIFDNQNKLTHLEGVTRDITSRLEMEKMLKESEEMFRSITEQSPTAIIIVQAGHMLYANARCAEMVGYSKEELMEWLPGQIEQIGVLHPSDAESILAQSEKKQNGEKEVRKSYSFRALHKDGHTVFIRLLSNPIVFKDQPAVLVNLFEITEAQWEADRI